MFPSLSSIALFYSFISNLLNGIKSTTPYSCDESAMFVSYTIDTDNFSKDSLNITMTCIDNPCLHFVTRYLYTSKKIMENITTYDCI